MLYVFRWQLSTPILWLVVHRFGTSIGATVIANLIGASIFFWVDKFIFTSRSIELWHHREIGICPRCGRKTSLWRLVKAKGYDKSEAEPIFLCRNCSKEKLKELNRKGIEITFMHPVE